ncbi:MAG: insulinase family protein, partial [Sporichthyaceae bacterium]
MRPAGLQQPGSTQTLSAGRYGGTIRRTVLPGGLRVITEALPAMRSVA